MYVKVFDINDLKNQEINMLRKVPSKFYSFTVIIIMTILIFIIVGNCIYYSKSQKYAATIILQGSDIYFNTNISFKTLSELDDYKLIIENKEYDFKLVNFEQNNTDNNYNITFKVDNFNVSDDKYIILSFKTKKTTLFKEIYEKIKEDLN